MSGIGKMLNSIGILIGILLGFIGMYSEISHQKEGVEKKIQELDNNTNAIVDSIQGYYKNVVTTRLASIVNSTNDDTFKEKIGNLSIGVEINDKVDNYYGVQNYASSSKFRLPDDVRQKIKTLQYLDINLRIKYKNINGIESEISKKIDCIPKELNLTDYNQFTCKQKLISMLGLVEKYEIKNINSIIKKSEKLKFAGRKDVKDYVENNQQ